MIWAFLNSNAFVGLATIITGAAAFAVYFRQKRDAKVNAARVLLMEIRNAEERLDVIRDKLASASTGDFPSVLNGKSWKTYSHLFVRDFDQDELRLMSDFYDYCELIDDMGRRNNNFFWVSTDEKAKVYQQTFAKLIVEASDSSDPAAAEAKRKAIFATLDQPGFSYTPVKTTNVMRDYVAKLRPITTSTCGAKLKRLAKMTD
jgi:hypothetical protein